MKKLILFTIALLLLITACNKQPQETAEQLTQQTEQTEQQTEIEQQPEEQKAPQQEIPVQEGGTLYLEIGRAHV